MKKYILCLLVLFSVTACEAGKFEEKRVRLHEMGHQDICTKHPDRCITVDGKSIEW